MTDKTKDARVAAGQDAAREAIGKLIGDDDAVARAHAEKAAAARPGERAPSAGDD